VNAVAGLPRPTPEASLSPLFASLSGRPVRASAIAAAVAVIAGMVIAVLVAVPVLVLWVEPTPLSF